MTAPKQNPGRPEKNDKPTRNLPGIVGDPNQPTQPTRREIERPDPARQPPVQQSPKSPPTPEFERRTPDVVEPPRADPEPTGLI